MPPDPDAWEDLLGLGMLEANYRLPQGLLKAVLRHESKGDPGAVSRAGARGLFQLMPETAFQYRVDAHNPLQAAPAAAKELASLYQKYDANLAKTLAAWNWGQGHLDRKGMENAPQETQQFLGRVMRDMPQRPFPTRAPNTDTPLPRERGQGRRTAHAAPAEAPSVAIDVQDFLRWQQAGQPPAPATPDVAPAAAQAVPNADPSQPAPVGSTPVEPAAVAPEPTTFPVMEGNMLDDVSAIVPTGLAPTGTLGQASAEAAREGLRTGIQTAGAVGGGIVGSGLGMPVVGTIVGGSLATRAANLLPAWMQPTGAAETPVVQTPVANIYPSDILGGLGAILPGAGVSTAKMPLALSPAGRALSAAEKKTAAQALDYAETYAQQAARAAQAYEQQASKDLLSVAGKQARVNQALSTKVANKTQRWADDVLKAETAWENAEALKRHAFETGTTEAYTKAETLAKQRIAEFKTTLAQHDTDMAQHMAMVKRMQALPEKYMPKLRTLEDVDRDLEFLRQGGRSAETVTQRLGADDIFDAQARLRLEREELESAGGAARQAGERTGSPYTPPSGGAPPPQPDPLLSFIRTPDAQGRFGIRLEGEALADDFEGLIRNREAKTSGLFNNKSGRSADEVAQAAHELGLIDSPDTNTLLRAIDDAMSGRPAGGRMGPMPEAPDFPPDAPPPRGTAGRRGRPERASDVLYKRLDDIAVEGPVDLAPAIDAAAAAKAQFGEGMPALQDARVRKVLNDLTAEDMHLEGSVSQVVGDVRALQRVIRGTSNSDVKYYLGQVVDGLHAAVQESALLHPETTGRGATLWRQARDVWRKEHAVDEVADMLKVGGVITEQRHGKETVLVGDPVKLLNQVRSSLEGRGSKRKSFLASGVLSEEETTGLLDDIRALVAAPAMPKGPVPLPGSVPVTQIREPIPSPRPEVPPAPAPFTPEPVPIIPPRQRPPAEPFAPPAPVDPELRTRPNLRAALAEILGAATAAQVLSGPTARNIALGATSIDVARRYLAWMMLTPGMRPLLKWAIRPNGTIDPVVIGVAAELMRLSGDDPGTTSQPSPPPSGTQEGQP